MPWFEFPEPEVKLPDPAKLPVVPSAPVRARALPFLPPVVRARALPFPFPFPFPLGGAQSVV